MLSHYTKFLILIIFLFSITSCRKKTSGPRLLQPNIILIVTDDQGYGDLGFHGNPVIKTPVLDSLAGKSTRFNQFYVSPVCAPTRASLLTGRYSIRTGVYDTYNGGAIMNDEEKTIPEYLKHAGYITAIFGKWHLGDSYPFRPSDQGFDHSLVHGAGGIGQPGDFYENYIKGDSSYFNPVLSENGKKIRTSGYCSDVYTRRAIEFMKDNKDHPFFVYLSYNAPHTPLQLPDDYYEMYREIPDTAFALSNVKGGTIPSKRSIEDAKRVYGMVTNIDDNLNRLFQFLGQSDMIENTLIIFITDNGPQQNRYNAGLRSRKGSVFEGGIRVPSFWSWPSRLQANREIEQVATHFDILPTLLDISGISPDTSAGKKPDGVSLWPLLSGDKQSIEERSIVYHWNRGYPEPYQNMAIRKGPYKLVGQGGYNMHASQFELFNLREDPYEKEDIGMDLPDTVNRLREELDRWYNHIINNKDLKPQRIVIGSEYENPVILNRNDAHGPMAKRWMDPTALGYWYATIAEEGKYTIRVRLFRSLGPGKLTFRAGTIQRSVDFDGPEEMDLFELKDLHLLDGDCIIEAWYDHEGLFYAPIYIEIEKTD